ncbi:hypothetical protein [Candidatus Palauibacter sp.]|uniref:hypothetical protein n=1 Tax=Candidatus Palauibacter sp. TaxID=3101350 RepID=UPI003CC51A96
MFVPWPADLVVVRVEMTALLPGARSVTAIEGAVHQLLLGTPRWTGRTTVGARDEDDGLGALLARLGDRRNHTEIPLSLPVPEELPDGLTATVGPDGDGRTVATLSGTAALRVGEWIRVGARLLQIDGLMGVASGQPVRYTTVAGALGVIAAPAGLVGVTVGAATVEVRIAPPYAPATELWLRVAPDPAPDGEIRAAWTARLERSATSAAAHTFTGPRPDPSSLGEAGEITLWADQARTLLLPLTNHSRVAVVPGGVVSDPVPVLPGRTVRVVLHPDSEPPVIATTDWHPPVAFEWLEAPVR